MQIIWTFLNKSWYKNRSLCFPESLSKCRLDLERFWLDGYSIDKVARVWVGRFFSIGGGEDELLEKVGNKQKHPRSGNLFTWAIPTTNWEGHPAADEKIVDTWFYILQSRVRYWYEHFIHSGCSYRIFRSESKIQRFLQYDRGACYFPERDGISSV